MNFSVFPELGLDWQEIVRADPGMTGMNSIVVTCIRVPECAPSYMRLSRNKVSDLLKRKMLPKFSWELNTTTAWKKDDK